MRWHRAGFRSYWRWKSRGWPGRPALPAEIRKLIREMSIANPLWGAPRVHGELLKLGIDVGQTSVAKYMVRTRRPPSQGWKTFLRNHADGIAAMDLFVVPTVSFRLLYGLLIMGHGRRQILWLGVTAHPTAEWIANQLTQAYGWERAPRYLIRDRNSCYGSVFTRRLRSLGIRDHPTSPRSPWQNGYAERLIGSIRRECLDHVVVFGERHLRHVLSCYMEYYNAARTHLSLGKDAPIHRAVQSVGRIQRDLFSAACTTNTHGFDLRQGQPLSAFQSCPDYTTAMLGHDFREAQQCGAHASVPSQGRTDRTRRSIGWVHQMPACSRWLASLIRTDLIYDRDSRRLRTAAKARRAMSIMAAI